MTDLEQRKVAKEFAERWKDKGYEKGQSQQFWTDLLENVLEIKNAATFIQFEDTVHIDTATGFIDAFIPSTKVLIEQKSIEKDLRKAIKQSDGSLLNPFQQAKRYSAELPYDDRPRWIVTCNFKSFLIYDMNNPNGEPEEILLKDLPKEYYRLSFLTDSKNDHIKKEEEISFKAGEIVGVLYDAFSKQYNDLSQDSSQKSLNELCVRLVFCLYAEDAGLFGRKNVFHDYLAKYEDLDQMRKALIDLFKVLDQPLNERDPYLEDDLNQFPYVNGGLFSNENIEIPRFTREIRETLLAKASDDFDWSEISPTIFGAVFESTLNPETRRSGGMHYTSIENIHKVIDPLFLDELRNELNEALNYKNEKTRNEALEKFQEHIGSLTFFDPACGSGNFLTETYLSLRRMENEAIEAKQQGRVELDFGDVVKVHINQFYGIEINDFAVKVATTALWIAEAQMLQETEKLLSRHLNFLPLKTYTNIIEGNALQIDWNSVISDLNCDYIMGNPPFIGKKEQSKTQKQELIDLYDKDIKQVGNVDYVSGWYLKACDYIKNTNIKCSFVSTNSITQGEQVPILWEQLYRKEIDIIFAHRTFRWDSEASSKAHVHCVIIGFMNNRFSKNVEKYIFNNNFQNKVKNINPYLVEGQPIIIKSRTKSISDVPQIMYGSMPIDNGYLILNEEDRMELLKENPSNEKFIRKYVGGYEIINNKDRWCIWLNGIPPIEIKNSAFINDRISKVKEFRQSSNRPQTIQLADTPYLFGEIRQPKTDMLVIPKVSSETRKYIPIAFITPSTIVNGSALIIPDANLYLFGVLISNIHMAWMRAVAGRMKSDYQYSGSIVYNNFVFPTPTVEQKKKIEETAKMILEARKLYNKYSLADLYNENYMPKELLRAHQLNDLAVWEAYGKKWDKKSESDCVAKLMEMYQALVNEK